jgi:hypothetical protein
VAGDRVPSERPDATVPVGLGRLWFGVLAAPAAWLLMEIVGYYLAARSCEPGTGGVPLTGVSNLRTTHVILDVIALVVASIGLLTAVRSWRALPQPRGEATAARGRAHFMAFLGVLTSVLFLGGLVLFGVPAFLVNVCSQAR